MQLQALGTGMHKAPLNPAAPSARVTPRATSRLPSGMPKEVKTQLFLVIFFFPCSLLGEVTAGGAAWWD